MKISGSEAFDCFNPNWQVTCILVFSIHSSYVFYSWHCTRLFLYISNRISLRSSEKKICLRFQAARCSQKFGGRAFCYAASKLWKNLPSKKSSHDSLSNFKCHVKIYRGYWREDMNFIFELQNNILRANAESE